MSRKEYGVFSIVCLFKLNITLGFEESAHNYILYTLLYNIANPKAKSKPGLVGIIIALKKLIIIIK